MNKIDYQALREAAVKATWGDWDSYKPHRGARGYEVRLSSQAIAQHVLKNNAEFIAAFNPKIALALLDERERNQQYIKRRDQENEDIALTVGRLRVELEAAKSKLNEQREYYESVISDGSKRIAELEKSEEQLINERDHAEYALADMYFAATGDRPEWSNCFSFSDAVDAVVDRIADLEAKQPSPVVPEEKPMPNPLSMYAVDAVAAIAEVRGWNACRAAMLQGKSEQPQNAQQNIPENIPGGNSPVTPDGWIGCSERMPDDGQHVIILCDGAFVLYAQYRDGEFFDIVRNGEEFFETQSRNVTHWMPLPEPPQEVNRG
ncbi:ead/Ea22-like family protein [Escherichia coli]|uniref:ead/Ea22-like family protein n=1 Tax=Escherichia coli TaxID=562 RepID=UPI002B2BEC76|nr:hypothetical protein VEE41_13060 [Escherichia coli]BEB64065.1 hypothetical protein VEE17_33900 [Escherichia coli]